MDHICNSTWELWNEILQLYSQEAEIFIAYAIGQWIFFRRLYWFQRCKVKDGSNLHINFICNLQNQKDCIKVSCQLSTFTFQVEVAGILNFLFQPPVKLLSQNTLSFRCSSQSKWLNGDYDSGKSPEHKLLLCWPIILGTQKSKAE